MAQLPNGTLVLAACRDNYKKDPAKRGFSIEVYESSDEGLTWTEIGESPLFGKEPSLTALPNGSLVLTVQDYGPGATHDRIPISRSSDGGRTWQTIELKGPDYPRDMIVEPDGSLLFVRALEWDWKGDDGNPNLQLCRSRDRGETWTCSEGQVDWDVAAFGEVSSIRLKDGRYLAALRTIAPNAPARDAHGFGVTVLTESTDGGKALVEAPADHVHRRGARLPDRTRRRAAAGHLLLVPFAVRRFRDGECKRGPGVRPQPTRATRIVGKEQRRLASHASAQGRELANGLCVDRISESAARFVCDGGRPLALARILTYSSRSVSLLPSNSEIPARSMFQEPKEDYVA